MDHPRRDRPSLRLPTYVYAQPGGYFVTICTQNRLCLFGHVEEGEMHRNAAGQMVQEVWESLTLRYPTSSWMPSLSCRTTFTASS